MNTLNELPEPTEPTGVDVNTLPATEELNLNVSNGNEKLQDPKERAIISLSEPNVSNVNVPEHIVICWDICSANLKSFYELPNGNTITSINMQKKAIEIFINLKLTINAKTKFALIILKNQEAIWYCDFTSDIKILIKKVKMVVGEISTEATFNYDGVMNLIKNNVKIFSYDKAQNINPPPFVTRMVILYGRSNCIPIISQEDQYIQFLKQNSHFYIDIIVAHEEECPFYKCNEIYDALMTLDNGYSYIYEVSKSSTLFHNYMAKLLAHPQQRRMQRDVTYTFPS